MARAVRASKYRMRAKNKKSSLVNQIVVIFTHKKNIMHLNVHFYLMNEHFSQEHADAQNNGEESENNLRFEWEDELAINTDIKEILTHRNSIYTLEGERGDADFFAYDIPATLVFDIVSMDGEITQLACSESIVESFELIDEAANKRLNVYLKEEEPHTNPIPGIYISLLEFPKELSN